MNKTFAFVFALLLSSVSIVHGFARKKRDTVCAVYFTVVEHDEETSNLNMVGLNKPQERWFEKHGAKDAPDICLANADPTGERVPIESLNENYFQSIVKSAPLYSIAWEEHRVFVPDTNGGHYAYSAHGILYRWNQSADDGKGDFVVLTPIHNTNRTILSSSSTSLLKDGLGEIKKRAAIDTRKLQPN